MVDDLAQNIYIKKAQGLCKWVAKQCQSATKQRPIILLVLKFVPSSIFMHLNIAINNANCDTSNRGCSPLAK